MLNEIMKRSEISCLLHLMNLQDTEVYLHSIGVATITEGMLSNARFSGSEKEEIVTGALLHDMGKLFLPFSITRNGKLFNDLDREIVKIHPILSKKIVQNNFSDMVQDICLSHHEKLDGSGYPLGLKEPDIPDYVQIVGVADMYEALTHNRSYKKSYEPVEAIGILTKDVDKHKISGDIFCLLDDYINC